ncbi:MAG: sigma 54-interacting transcriptional regulator [Nibricoccus sp.]
MSKLLSQVLREEDRLFAEAVKRINASNPFLPERIAAEAAALGADFQAAGAEWNTRPPTTASHPNIIAIAARCANIVAQVRTRWPKEGRVAAADLALYEEVAGYWLYQTYAPRFDRVILTSLQGKGEGGRVDFFPAFRDDVQRCFILPGLLVLDTHTAPHLFACAFQIRRAFHNIFLSLVGSSKPMAQLRAAIWQSICTHNLDRYRRALYAHMGDFATLITGPSGTGKELVARALAMSRYIPYEAKRGGFHEDFAQGFYPLNLAALSPTLIESELFGHRRGAFTGALADRAGWMEVCPPSGAVFLDEIGEVDASIQVKLLRVLQSRTFQPLGSTETLHFKGKIIAATNRDLPTEIRAARFREDFYYRLCSDQIVTPSLREQLDDAPGDLLTMTRHIAQKMLGNDEAEPFAREAIEWINKNLGNRYAWPGNFRELEQCLRNLVLRGDYKPAGPLEHGAADDWNTIIERGTLTAEQLLERYTRIVYEQAGTIEETARRLDLDRRTVKARLAGFSKKTSTL